MARLARLVIPGVPYHVTQRGNRRLPTFFEDGDFALYRDLLADGARRAGASVWAYCLMPNHVHVIVVLADPDGLNYGDSLLNALNSLRLRSRLGAAFSWR